VFGELQSKKLLKKLPDDISSQILGLLERCKFIIMHEFLISCLVPSSLKSVVCQLIAYNCSPTIRLI
jgi:hypothetical protein